VAPEGAHFTVTLADVEKHVVLEVAE